MALAPSKSEYGAQDVDSKGGRRSDHDSSEDPCCSLSGVQRGGAPVGPAAGRRGVRLRRVRFAAGGGEPRAAGARALRADRGRRRGPGRAPLIFYRRALAGLARILGLKKKVTAEARRARSPEEKVRTTEERAPRPSLLPSSVLRVLRASAVSLGLRAKPALRG